MSTKDKAKEGIGVSGGESFSWEGERLNHGKIRIGYISSCFRQHIVSRFANAFFLNFDSRVFEVCGYSMGTEDEVSVQLREKTLLWRNLIGMGAGDIARQIYEDEVDVLIDLSWGEEYGAAQIFRCHPAPVQIHGLCGAAGCTGVDGTAHAACSFDSCTQGELRTIGCVDVDWSQLSFPSVSLCYQACRGMPSYIAPAPFLRTGHVTFASMEPIGKVAEELLKTWKRILEQTGESILLLKVPGSSVEIRDVENRLSELDFPMDRVLIENAAKDNREYFDTYARVDILLDACLPCGDGRVCDALYMGVPVITMQEGIAADMLSGSGMGKLCGSSLEEYAAAAIALAAHPDEIRDLHLTLRWRLEKTSAMNGDRYMTEVEEVYGKLYCNWQKKVLENFSERQRQSLAEMKLAYDNGQWETVIRNGTWLEWSGHSFEKVASNVASAYSMLEDYARSLFWCEKALGDDPDSEQVIYQRILSMQKLGYLLETFDLCNRVLSGGIVLELRGVLTKSRAYVGYLLGSKDMQKYFWEAYECAVDESKKRGMYSPWLMSYNFEGDGDDNLLEKHKGYEKFFRGVRLYSHNVKRHHKKIRIGYMSPDFCCHVMQNFIFPFFQYFDRKNFEVYAYNLSDKYDLYTARMKALADGWRDVKGYAPEMIAKQIYSDEIDILFDLAGHTNGIGLNSMAWKPAPIQISGLGYMATTGISKVDYFLTDAFVDPPGEHEAAFVEELLRVRSQFCYTSSSDNMPDTGGAPCRGRGWVLFGVFNGYRKFNDEMLLAWKEILSQLPGSKLLIKCQGLFAPTMKLEAYGRLKKLGFEMERVIIENETADYMNRYLDVDIALDTYPYPGGGTTCDALYMGVPVISRYGNRRSTRFGYSILQNVGVGELATDSLEGYIEMAVAVAKDWDLLEYMHRNLRTMMKKSPVMDAEGYMREIEALYHEIWNRWLESGRS